MTANQTLLQPVGELALAAALYPASMRDALYFDSNARNARNLLCAARCLLGTARHLLLATDCVLVALHLLFATDCTLDVTYYLLLATDCALDVMYSLLLIACHFLGATD